MEKTKFNYKGVTYNHRTTRNDSKTGVRFIKYITDTLVNSDGHEYYCSICFYYDRSMYFNPQVWNYVYRDGVRSDFVECNIAPMTPEEQQATPRFIAPDYKRYNHNKFIQYVNDFISTLDN